MNKLSLTLFTCFCFTQIFAQTSPIIIQTAHTALVYKVNNNKHLVQAYFGESLADKADYNKLAGSRVDAFITGGMNIIREPALQVTHADGNPSLQLLFTGVEMETPDANISITHVKLKDPAYAFEVTLHFKTYAKEDVIEQWSTIEHKEKSAVTLNRYASASLQFKEDKYFITHFFGDWANEMRMEETLLPEGVYNVQSKLGTRATNFDMPSFMLSIDKPAEEESGEVIAGTLAWSGNFNMDFENIRYSEDFGHMLQIIPGINAYSSEYSLAPGEVFTTPSFIYTYSFKGKGQASRNLHHWALNYGIWKGREHRLTLLNNWEATFFDFDQNKLTALFDDAKKLGVEMFLLDDGWFGNKHPRNADTAGLGDWQPNKLKLPDGIGYLVKEAEKKGVKFGIWIEPEMVNPKSDLYEKHPDWVIHLPNREENLRRNQLVLDLTNPAVQTHVFNVVNDLMQQNGGNIAYIKWDCNRYMSNVYSPYLKNKQGNLFVDYTRGFYSVLEKIRARYPNLEMMLCSGGGGRAEYGGLKYFQEFWPSDNTDALSRIFIQWGYSYFFPAATMCAHITSSGNQSIKFKTDVAMMGKLGFDIQVSHLKPEELAYCQQAVANYKRLQDVIGYGDLYRLQSPYAGNTAALMYVNDDHKKAVLFAFNMQSRSGDEYQKIQLKGLDANKKYLLKEINLNDESKPSFRQSGRHFTGDFLMKAGIDWYLRETLTSSIIEITEVD